MIKLVDIKTQQVMCFSSRLKDLIRSIWQVFESKKVDDHHKVYLYGRISELGGGFKQFWFSPDPWGNDPI